MTRYEHAVLHRLDAILDELKAAREERAAMKEAAKQAAKDNLEEWNQWMENWKSTRDGRLKRFNERFKDIFKTD